MGLGGEGKGGRQEWWEQDQRFAYINNIFFVFDIIVLQDRRKKARASKSRDSSRKSTGGVEDLVISVGEEENDHHSRASTMNFIPPKDVPGVMASNVILLFIALYNSN